MVEPGIRQVEGTRHLFVQQVAVEDSQRRSKSGLIWRRWILCGVGWGGFVVMVEGEVQTEISDR